MFNRLRNIDKLAEKRTKKRIKLGVESLSGALVDLLSFVRTLICDVVFEMFVRSANHAYHRKMYIIKKLAYIV